MLGDADTSGADGDADVAFARYRGFESWRLGGQN